MHDEEPALAYYNYRFYNPKDGIRDIGVTGVQTCALPISEVTITSARALTPMEQFTYATT